MSDVIISYMSYQQRTWQTAGITTSLVSRHHYSRAYTNTYDTPNYTCFTVTAELCKKKIALLGVWGYDLDTVLFSLLLVLGFYGYLILDLASALELDRAGN